MATGSYMISCCSQNQTDKYDSEKMAVVSDDSAKVQIWLSYVKCNGEDHLFLHDSYNNCAIDSLTTKAFRGDSVIWSLDPWSGIEKLNKIEFTTDWTSLIEGDFFIDSSKNKIKIKIKEDANAGTFKYNIKYKIEGSKDITTVDPYIRIPPEANK